MKISKQVWIEDGIKWNKLRQRELSHKNRYRGFGYIVCTSPQEHLLFEIMETRFLNDYYQEATLLAICKSKKQAIMQVVQWVDAIYNVQTISYTQL